MSHRVRLVTLPLRYLSKQNRGLWVFLDMTQDCRLQLRTSFASYRDGVRNKVPILVSEIFWNPGKACRF